MRRLARFVSKFARKACWELEHKMASDPPKGWNDPPVLSYDVATDTPSKKPQLNKRVPFPSSGLTKSILTPSDCSCEGIQLLPQADNQNHLTATAIELPLTQLPPPPSLPVSNQESLGSHQNDESSNKECFQNRDFQNDTLSILKQCLAVCLKTLQKRTADDIERRLGILTNMWNEGKLNEDVQIRMYKFSQALYAGEYDQANGIHMSLIVDHASQVTPWMVGVKHLIHESRKIELHLANDQSSGVTPLKETDSPCVATSNS